jgi:four helix bundle protein
MTVNGLENGKYDLEGRTLSFAVQVREFIRKIVKNILNQDDIKQLLRSSGSVGANYIEANEAISNKDFLLRIKICRKEAKESRFWLRILRLDNSLNLEQTRQELIQEAFELTKIFGKIIQNKSSKE